MLNGVHGSILNLGEILNSAVPCFAHAKKKWYVKSWLRLIKSHNKSNMFLNIDTEMKIYHIFLINSFATNSQSIFYDPIVCRRIESLATILHWSHHYMTLTYLLIMRCHVSQCNYCQPCIAVRYGSTNLVSSNRCYWVAF